MQGMSLVVCHQTHWLAACSFRQADEVSLPSLAVCTVAVTDTLTTFTVCIPSAYFIHAPSLFRHRPSKSLPLARLIARPPSQPHLDATMSWFGGGNRRDEYDERITETEQYSTDYDRRGGYGYGGGPRQDERITETTTTYYTNDRPPPPQCPYPWRPHWDDRERRYIFINEQTGERTWDFPDRRGYVGETTTTYPEGRRGESQRHGGGHGMMYGAMAGVAGLAGGAFLAHEFHDNKDRIEDGVEDFPENAARWTGERVQEVEDIPENVEAGFDRFGNRIEQGFDNVVDDVVDAPENVANWAGRRVEGVEQFGDRIGDAYDDGKNEEREEDYQRDDRW
ncbi:hypothetical protein BAUCODRAFT_34647 [Baudoinia panamericana UAMH 10762]|uniref:WW domain-containing protein n=1 Tax=Baudoinia panamericana (strain UAMH 10762) TaxID=717646 RepID=M2LNF4_BAUPA|nr:uncharacterized protein BAUCODRAFT_34647 [Baudoinia panamericana UAMH 10762]EMC95882.1 hypothetical protein BAUCODRAFT_34647 [Baudoinia panamericana UAMH 10762]